MLDFLLRGAKNRYLKDRQRLSATEKGARVPVAVLRGLRSQALIQIASAPCSQISLPTQRSVLQTARLLCSSTCSAILASSATNLAQGPRKTSHCRYETKQLSRELTTHLNACNDRRKVQLQAQILCRGQHGGGTAGLICARAVDQ